MPRLLAAALLLGLVTRVADARVPAFVRQTGLTCSQCHVSWTNAADFTFTGQKFRLNGYHWPWRPDTTQPVPEGAIERDALATIARMLSIRARGIVAQGSKAASDPNLSEPNAGPVTTNPLGPIDVYVAGPLGEHVGVWGDICGYRGRDEIIAPSMEGTCARSGGYLGVSQLAVQASGTAGGSILGFALTLVKAGRGHTFLGMTPATAPNHQPYAPGIGSDEEVFVSSGFYGFLWDRVALKLGAETADNTHENNHVNSRIEAGVFPLNTDAGWVLLTWMRKFGSDMTPILASIPGVTALTEGQFGYSSASTAHAVRSMYSLSYGFSGRGPHSLVGSLNLSSESDEYYDGGLASMRAVGTTLRYYFQHKYGADLYIYNFAKWEYTDPTGVPHPIPQNTGLAGRLVYAPALNLSFYVEAANVQSARLDQDWRNGNYWTVSGQFLW